MMIKKCIALMLVATITATANASLIKNGDFDNGDADWSDQSAWGNFYYTDGPDTITSMGGWGNGVDWSNTSIWQNTNAIFQANTVYTMDVVWRDPSDGNNVDNIQLLLQDVTAGWTDVASEIHSSPLDDVWVTSTMTFDTASNPAVVGHEIGASVRLTSPTGAWLHIDSVSLTIPEPATFSLLALGGLAIIFGRRK